MAINDPRTNASSFQDEMAGVTAGTADDYNDQDPGNDEDIAQDLAKSKNEQRMQLLKDKLKEKALKKVEKEIAKTAVKAGARSLVLYAFSYIGGAVLVIIAVITLILMMLWYVHGECQADGLKGFFARITSTGASWVGLTDGDICAELAVAFSGFEGGTEGGAGGGTSYETPLPPITGGLTDAAARDQLLAANITVNHPQPRTSLEGIKQAVITEVINLKKACDANAGSGGPCRVMVSGGTERTGGHAPGPCSHLSGNKIDIRSQSPDYKLITRYIEERLTLGAPREGLPRYMNGSVSYVKEPDHWDIGPIGC